MITPRARRRIGIGAALAVGAALLGAVPALHATAADTSCPDVLFFGARGSGEVGDYDGAGLGLGPVVGKLYRDLDGRVTAAHKVMKLGVVHYDAVKVADLTGVLKAAHLGFRYDSSVSGGVTAATALVTSTLGGLPAGCSPKVVLAGYSQGAQVLGTAVAKLPTAVRNRITAIALLGDPYFNADDSTADRGSYDVGHYGALSVRGPWSGATSSNVVSYCHDGDPICNLDLPVVSLFGATVYVRDVARIAAIAALKHQGLFDEHTNYPSSGDVDRAVSHVARLLGLSAPPATTAPLDVVFVIDSTGSMSGQIDAVEANVAALATTIAAHSTSYRFALVDYKDEPAQDSAYQARVDVPFTTNTAAFTTGVKSITADGGGDTPESVYDGVMTGLNLPWRAGVKKAVIVIGDAPGKNPEPVTGYTLKSVVDKAFAVDPAQIYSVPVGGDTDATTFLKALSDATGGTVADASDSDTFVGNLEKALTQAGSAPVAAVTGPVHATAGVASTFSAKDTAFDDADPVVAYDWNFGTGTPKGSYDTTTTTPLVKHAYAKPGSYEVALRVRTKSGLAGLATTTLTVTAAPTEKPGAPTGLAGSVDGDDAVLHFSHGGGGAVQYYAIKDGTGAVVDAFTPSGAAVEEWRRPDLSKTGGSATFTVYAVNAAGISAPAGPVTVSSKAGDTPPVGTPDSYDGLSGEPVTVPAPGVLGNDTDKDAGDALTAALVTGPAHGTLSLAPNGSFTYTPAAGFTGNDTFTYKAVDRAGQASGPTTVTLHLTALTTSGQPFTFVASGSNAVLLGGRIAKGGFTYTVKRGVVTAVSGKATVEDKWRHRWTVTMATAKGSSPAQVTVTVSARGKRIVYKGRGVLQFLGGRLTGYFERTSTKRPGQFSFVIRRGLHRG